LNIACISCEENISDSSGPGKKCKALAMSGGGSRGAFEAGALWGIHFTDKDKTAMEYDVVTGVSAGSVNGGLVGIYAIGNETGMVTYLSDAWANLTTDTVYREWDGGIINGLFKQSGVFNDTYLLNYLEERFKSFGS